MITVEDFIDAATATGLPGRERVLAMVKVVAKFNKVGVTRDAIMALGFDEFVRLYLSCDAEVGAEINAAADAIRGVLKERQS